MGTAKARADELVLAAAFLGLSSSRAVVDLAVTELLDRMHEAPGFTEAVTSARAHRLVTETEDHLREVTR